MKKFIPSLTEVVKGLLITMVSLIVIKMLPLPAAIKDRM